MSVTARVLKTAMKDSDGKYITFDTLAVNYEKVNEPGTPFNRSYDDVESMLEEDNGD